MSGLSASSASIPAAPPPKAPEAKQPESKDAKPAQGGAPAPQKGIENTDDEIAALEAAGSKTKAPQRGVESKTAAPEKGAQSKTDAPAEQKDAPKEKQRVKLKTKVDGEEAEEEYDEDQLRMLVQKAKAADKRIKESVQAKREREQEIEALKKDPFAYLKDKHGVDALEMAAQELIRRHEESQLPPEERALRERARAVEQREQEIAQQLKQQQEAQEKAQEAYFFEQYAKNYGEAGKALGYDNDFTAKHVVPEMARIERPFVDAGIELQMADIVRIVGERHDTIASMRLKSIASKEGPALLDGLEKLSPGIVEAVRKAIVAKHRASQGIVPKPPPQAERETLKVPSNKREERDAILSLRGFR